MKVKFTLENQENLLSISHGGYIVEMSRDEHEKYLEIERRYFDMQNELKRKARNADGEKLLDVERFGRG